MLTKQELALIHIAKAELGLTDDEYRDLLRSTCNVESSKQLTHRECDKLMRRFCDLGFKLKIKTPKPKIRQTKIQATETDPDALVTPAQQFKIQELYGQLGWNLERQNAFHQRMVKKSWPQTRAEANKITEALKAMVARGYGKEVK
jgi:hypothetical protein